MTTLEAAREFGAAANDGARADILDAQRRGRAATATAAVQDALFGEFGEIQEALFS